MKTGVIVTNKTKREGQQAQHAKQRSERRSQLADGGIHGTDAQVHSSRRQEATDSKTVVRPPERRWQRASNLPVIPDRDGFSYRWAAIDGRTRGDQSGVSKRLREGWEIVRPKDLDGDSLPTHLLDRRGEVIGNGEHVLMKIPEEMLAQRNEYYAEKRDTVTAALEYEHKEHSDDRMPLTRKAKSRTEFVRIKRKKQGSAARKVADDDDE